MDQDDVLVKFDILSELEHMRSNEIELQLYHVICDNDDGTFGEWNYEQQQSQIINGPELFRDKYINHICFGCVWMGIYNTSLVKRVEPFVENKLSHDTDWCYRCAYEAKKIQYLPLTIYSYKNNPKSQTHNVPCVYLKWRVQQNIRIWQWAKLVTQEKEAVYDTAMDFCMWNIKGIGIIWRYNLLDRYRFFHGFSKYELGIIKTLPGDSWQLKMLNHPTFSQWSLFFLSPVLRCVRWFKHLRR